MASRRAICSSWAGRRSLGYGGQIVDAAVERVEIDGSSFQVRLDSGLSVSARRLVIATGLRDELPEIPGLRERWARDVLHCPYCHGFEVRDQVLGVLGWAPGAATYAQIVRQWSDDVVYFASGTTLTATEREQLEARSITVVDGAVERVVIEDDQLRGVELDDKRVIELDALFVPPRFVPNNDLLVGSAATSTTTAGRSPTPRDARASQASGSRATSQTRVHR